jgi:hypothetical protein
MPYMVLQLGLEQLCFRCGAWHLLLSGGERHEHSHASKYLYVECPGGAQFKPGRYFVGQAGTPSDHPVREASR